MDKLLPTLILLKTDNVEPSLQKDLIEIPLPAANQLRTEMPDAPGAPWPHWENLEKRLTADPILPVARKE
jgi:hypothetical protein